MDLNFLKRKPFNLDQKSLSWVTQTLSSLTQKDKIGQLLVLQCLHPDKANVNKLLAYKPGALHLAHTLKPQEMIHTVTHAAKHSTTPLLYSGDLENGIMNVLPDQFIYQSQLGTAATGNPKYAENMGFIAGTVGKSCGYNWSFTPDIDIILNFRNSITGTRTFGSDPETVLSMASAYIQGMQSTNVAVTLKHWPGDGVDDRDQHLVTTNNSLTMDEWRNSFGRVYQELITRGAQTIMSAHITLPAYDRECDPNISAHDILPASINPRLNNDLLRKELGFNGLIVSDASLMGGLTSQGPRSTILPMIIQNGCDMLLYSENPYIDMSYLGSALQDGRLTAERLDMAIARILGLKASLGLHTHEKERESPRPLDQEDQIRIERMVDSCFENSITLVKDTQNIIPLSPKTQNRVLLFQTPQTKIPFDTTYDFEPFLTAKGFSVTHAKEGLDIDPDLFDIIIYALNQFEMFGSGSYTIEWPLLHNGLFKGFHRYWDLIPTIMISLNNPFHLYEAPRVKTYINAYSSHNKTLSALCDMLVGELPFTGENPIDPFCSLDEARL